MKRHLHKNRYELTGPEKEALWQALPQPGPAARERRRFSPRTAGVALTTALAACALVLWTGPRVKDAIFVELAAEAPSGLLGAPAGERQPAAPNLVDSRQADRVKSDDDGGTAGEATPPPPARTIDPIFSKEIGTEGVESPVETGSLAEEAPRVTTMDAPTTADDVGRTADAKTIDREIFGRNALESIEDGMSKQAGAVRRAGEIHMRGGRSGDVQMEADIPVPVEPRVRMRSAAKSIPPEAPETMGSVTGGTTPPNGQSAELMYFEHSGVNPFVATEDDALSTFAVDVDDASWSMARSYFDRGALPPAAAVRVEEFVNAFAPGWPVHTEGDLRIHVDGAPSRFGDGYHLLRVGIAGRDLEPDARTAANLVFVIDISGSMRREDRLGAVRQSLTMLLDELREGDRMGIVVYGGRGEVRLQPTDVSRRSVIQAAIDGLRPDGSTNAYEGLALAYAMAREHYEAGKINRLVLCSDGVANNGATTVAEEMLAMVRESNDEGISLSTVGFGMGNYNDVLMEKLANRGDGNYAYVDSREEAAQVFRENLTGMLETVAREAKVQVEFDPRHVSRWRLLGYENRDVADRDFRNDAVDAGEIGAGHRVTAFYEVKLTDAGRAAEELGVVRLRWEAPRHDTARAGEVTEIAEPLARAAVADNFGEAALGLRLQAVVAEFAEILRGSYWAKESTLADLVPVADGLAAEAGADAAEVARLVRTAARLQAEKEARANPDGR